MAGKKVVAGGIQATRILALADATSLTNLGSEMFWHVDGTSRLLLCGFRNGADIQSGLFPAQDVIFETPLVIGTKGQKIGDVVKSSSKASVVLDIPLFGERTLSATIASTVTYLGFLPVFDTGIGPLNNVLRMSMKVGGGLLISPF